MPTLNKLQNSYQTGITKFRYNCHSPSKVATREKLSISGIRWLKLLVEELMDWKTLLNILEYHKINTYITIFMFYLKCQRFKFSFNQCTFNLIVRLLFSNNPHFITLIKIYLQTYFRCFSCISKYSTEENLNRNNRLN